MKKYRTVLISLLIVAVTLTFTPVMAFAEADITEEVIVDTDSASEEITEAETIVEETEEITEAETTVEENEEIVETETKAEEAEEIIEEEMPPEEPETEYFSDDAETVGLMSAKAGITSIQFIPAKPLEIIENIHGEYTNVIYEGSEREQTVPEFFRYTYYSQIYSFGNKIVINGSETFEYKAIDVDGGQVLGFFNSNKEDIEEKYGYPNTEDDQDENHWSLGSHSAKIRLGGKTCDITVTVIKNPVKTIQYVPAEPITLIENEDGCFDYVKVYDEETGQYIKEEYFNYNVWNKIFSAGNKLVINGSETFVCMESDNQESFYNDAGESLLSKYGDIPSYVDKQEENHLTFGSNTVTVAFMGLTCEVEVTVGDGAVTSLQFVPAKNLKLVKNVDGEFVTIEVPNIDEPDSHEEEVFYYTYEDKIFAKGNKIIINRNETFEYKTVDGYTDFHNSFGESLTSKYGAEVILSDDQKNHPWTLGSDNIVTLSFRNQSCEVCFTIIEKIDINLAKASVNSVTYTGSKRKPDILLTYDGEEIERYSDYDVTYKNNLNIGTATAVISGFQHFTGTKTINFKIKGDLSKAATKVSVSAIPDKTYTGSVIKPEPTVKAIGTSGKVVTLKKGTDYTLSYSANKNVGKATVTIKGKGNYTGTKKVTFKINPKGTSLKTLTATSKGFKATWTKQATKMSTSYITGYQIQYSTSSKFTTATTKTVTATKYSTVSKAITKLTAKKKYYVRIRTYKTVSGTKYYSPWSASKYVTTKA